MTAAVRHLAFHYLGCATQGDGEVRVPSRIGQFLDTLADAVDTLTVVAYEPTDPDSIEDRVDFVLRRGDVHVCSLGPKASWRSYASRRRHVDAIISQHSPSWDVLMFYLPNRRAGLVMRAARSTRIASFMVGYTPTSVWHSPLPPVKKAIHMLATYAAELIFHRILRASAVVFVNSLELKEQYERFARRLVVTPMSARRERHSFHADDRLANGNANIMISGRITADKGVFEALDAFAAIRDELPGARLHVIGDGPSMDTLVTRAEELRVTDAVVLHGWMAADDRLFELYAQMDVLLLPSYAEGVPYTVWEAMANSVLVVCTPVGGLKHAFSDEREVLFVPPGESQAIVTAVRRLVREPSLRHTLLRNGRERAQESSLESVTAGMMRSFEETWPDLTGR